MKTIGILSCIVGTLLGFYAFSMDVSVEIGYSGSNPYGLPDRVNNLGLMSLRQNYLTISCVLLLAGILMIVFTKKPTEKEKHRYREFYELAKKAEYKEQYSIAVENYTDALFHLETDYNGKSMSKADNESRKKLILTLKEKVTYLKNNIPNKES